jgi:hypothetical protein
VGNQGNEFAAYCDEAQNTTSAKDRATIICQNKGPSPVQVTILSESDIARHPEVRKIENAIRIKKRELETAKKVTPLVQKNVDELEDAVVQLEYDLGDKKADLAKPTSPTTPASSASTNSGNLDSACTQFKECQNRENGKTSIQGSTTTTTGGCSELNAFAQNVLNLSPERAKLGTTPAMCTAASNSGREDSPKGWMGAMDTFNAELRKQMGTTGQ